MRLTPTKMEHKFCSFNSRGLKKFVERGYKRLSASEYQKKGLQAHKAALTGDVEELKVIFSAVARIPLQDPYGSTPLHLSARSNQIKATKWLLKYTDIDPLLTAGNGETAAHVAAARGHTQVLKLMLVDVKVKNAMSLLTDRNGLSILHLAIIKQHIPCVRLLVNELPAKALGPVSNSRVTGVTAGHIAASVGNVEALKIIYNKNKNYVTEPAADGTTPLFYAAQSGNLDAVVYLHLKAKASLTDTTSEGWAPVHVAAQAGHINILDYLMQCLGNDILTTRTNDGSTPLHFASVMGHTKLAYWLIAHDPSDSMIVSQDIMGHTPAHDAAEQGHSEVLKVLVAKGASLHSTNKDGITPYSLAIRSKNLDLANFVASYIAASPKVRSKPADKSRKSILRSDPFESPYDMVDDSYHQLPGQGDVTVSKSVVSPKEDLHKKTRSRSFSVGPNENEGNIRKLFTRRKSAGVPFSISNPNFNSSDDSENEEGRNLEKKKVKSRRSSLTKQSNESNSRRGSAQTLGSRRSSKQHTPKALKQSQPSEPTILSSDNQEDECSKYENPYEEIEVARQSLDTPESSTSLSTSTLLKTLKAPQYTTISESQRDSRHHVKSIKRALQPFGDTKEKEGFLVDSAEFGFRPKHSTNPLQRVKPVLPSEDTEVTDHSSSDHGDHLNGLAFSQQPHKDSTSPEIGKEAPIYATVDPEYILKKRKSKKQSEMTVTEHDSSQRKNGSLENSPEKMFGPMLPTSLDQTTLLKEFVSREVDSIIQHVLAKGNGQSSNGKVEGIILRPSQTVTGDGPKEDGALMEANVDEQTANENEPGYEENTSDLNTCTGEVGMDSKEKRSNQEIAGANLSSLVTTGMVQEKSHHKKEGPVSSGKMENLCNENQSDCKTMGEMVIKEKVPSKYKIYISDDPPTVITNESKTMKQEWSKSHVTSASDIPQPKTTRRSSVVQISIRDIDESHPSQSDEELLLGLEKHPSLPDLSEKYGLKKVKQQQWKTFSDPSIEVTSGANKELKEKLTLRHQYIVIIPES